MRLNDVPNSAPITYMVNGRQSVAVVVGNGGAWRRRSGLVPEIKNLPDRSAAIRRSNCPMRQVGGLLLPVLRPITSHAGRCA